MFTQEENTLSSSSSVQGVMPLSLEENGVMIALHLIDGEPLFGSRKALKQSKNLVRLPAFDSRGTTNLLKLYQQPITWVKNCFESVKLITRLVRSATG